MNASRHTGQFFGGGSQIRNSFDKVISYDTSSLLDGLLEKENKGRNGNQQHATVIPKLKRPESSQISPAIEGLKGTIRNRGER